MGSYADAYRGVALGADPYDLALASDIVENVHEIIVRGVEAMHEWCLATRYGAKDPPDGYVSARDLIETFIELRPGLDGDHEELYRRAVVLLTSIVLAEAKRSTKYWGIDSPDEGYCSGCSSVLPLEEFAETHPRPTQCTRCIELHRARKRRKRRKKQ